MAVIDLKNVTIKLTDGRQGTLTLNSVAANADLTFTDKSKHRGSRTVRVALVNPGGSGALSVAVATNTFDITVTLARTTGTITSTANDVKAAIEGNSTANALVSVTVEGTGLGVVDAFALTALTSGPRTLTVKIGEGNLTWTEHKNREYIKDRGKLSTVRDADEEPMDVRLQFVWEYIKGDGGGTPTPVDVLKQLGDASAWTSTSSDACEPYCIDVELYNDVQCSGVADEYTILEEFRYETLEFDPKANSISVTGKCNKLVANNLRAA